jgi:tetratricopeptide (TPR) repeat protein
LQLTLFLLPAAMAASLMAQVSGGMGGTTPTTGSGGQTSVQASPKGIDASRPVHITGKVVIEDGSAGLQNITIERVCGGISKTVAYTDSRGRFSFQWGDRSAIVTDAADSGSGSARHSNSTGFGSAQSAGGASALAADPFGSRMMNCALRANLAGFSSDTVNLFNRGASDNPDIGVIVLRSMAGVEGTSVSVTSAMAPRDARKAYERGLQSMLKNRTEDALKDFEKAVGIYPKYADAWMNLGKAHLEVQRIGPAREAFTQAILCDPKLVEPYVDLGLLAARDQDWRESAKYLDRAMELDPVGLPQAWYADAVANYNLKRYEEAEKGARAAVKLDPRHANPRSGYLLGLVLAEKRDYAGAAAELSEYIKLAPNAPDLAQVKDQLAQIGRLMSASK